MKVGVDYTSMDGCRWSVLRGTFYLHTYRKIIEEHVLPFMNKKNGSPGSFVPQEDYR